MGGRIRDRNKILAGKLSVGEDPLLGLKREVSEEVGITDGITFDEKNITKVENITDAYSYPGLIANYTTLRIPAYTDQHSGGKSFETYEENNGSTHYWKWIELDK